MEKEDLVSLKNFPGIFSQEILSAKPFVYLLNIDETTNQEMLRKSLGLPEEEIIFINLKEELEALDLSPEERKEIGIGPSLLDLLIKACYNKLKLVTFFTIKGGKELRAWAIPQGTSIKEAGARVHTDFKEKFICAQVLSYQDFISSGGWQAAQKEGKLKTQGKNYVVQEGDIIEFKIAP